MVVGLKNTNRIRSTRLHKWLQEGYKEGKVFNGQKHRIKQFLIKLTLDDVEQIKEST